MPSLADYQFYLCPQLLATDRLPFRRTDWGFYQVTDCAYYPGGPVVQTFSFPPFGQFNLAGGDGGQYFLPFPSTLGDFWVIGGTQDSGTPVQYFVGPEYGGSGWIALGADASDAWTVVAGRTAIAPSPDAMPALGAQQMRYVKQFVTLPFTFFGGPAIPVTVEAVVTEVYSGQSGPAQPPASSMERAFYAAGWGCVRWEAWRNDGTPAPVGLDQRMPPVGWPAPAPGWVMVDGRTWTNLISPSDPRLQGSVQALADFGWAL